MCRNLENSRKVLLGQIENNVIRARNFININTSLDEKYDHQLEALTIASHGIGNSITHNNPKVAGLSTPTSLKTLKEIVKEILFMWVTSINIYHIRN